MKIIFGSGLRKAWRLLNKKAKSEKFYNSFKDNRIRSICRDSSGKVWIGTMNGIQVFDPNKNNFTFINKENRESLFNNSVQTIFTDRQGIVWINCYNGGINKYGKDEKNFSFYRNENGNRNSLSSNVVKSLTEDKEGNIWIGTSGGGLNFLNLHSNNFRRFDLRELTNGTKGNNFVQSLSFDGKNNLWIGTFSGVIIFNPSSGKADLLKAKLNGKLVPINFSVESIFIDENKIYFGTAGYGLFVFNRTNKQMEKIDLGPPETVNYILTILNDSENNLWIGTFGGLLKIDSKGRKNFFRYNEKIKSSLSNNYVFSILEDKKGTLWIGTSNGLNKFNKVHNTFKHYFEKDGLPNGVINSMVQDNSGSIWISTNKGISKFDINDGSFTNYDVSDGMGGNIFSREAFLMAANRKIYFGGYEGLTYFSPDEMELSNYNPPVYITGLSANQNGVEKKIYPENEKVNLSFDENYLKINFASLDFASPHKNKYKYKLEGFDKNWTYSGKPASVIYSSLPPGNYILKIKGSNNDGIWSKNIATLAISVAPPFWKTFPFISGAAVFIFFLALLFHKIRVKQKINSALTIERIRNEEHEKIKRKTALDFHDELGHRLTRISLLTEIIRRKIDTTSPTITTLLDKIYENSFLLYNGTKDFIWSIDPQKDSLYELLVRLKDFGDDLFSETDIYFEVAGISDELKTTPLSQDWRRHIALIFKEGMNNSLKYAGGKRVLLNSFIHNNEITISLVDDGIGIADLKV